MVPINSFFIIFLVCISSCVFAQNDVDSLKYQQKVTRADVMFRHPTKDNRGIVYLSDQYFTFKVRRSKNFWMNFSIPYRRIEKIKRCNALIFPNQITILTTDGKKYKLGTYRRKKIIELTRQRISSH